MTNAKPAAEDAAAETAVRDALARFISAFEQGDVEAMRAAFAPDAVTFPRTVMGAAARRPVEAAAYRRVEGIDPQMLAVIGERRRRKSGPPYLHIEPRDLDVRLYADAALVTFHLGDDSDLGRRTFVLARAGDDWKIVHMHASNVLSGE
jgi:ketosteroid isomerase-like protein